MFFKIRQFATQCLEDYTVNSAKMNNTRWPKKVTCKKKDIKIANNSQLDVKPLQKIISLVNDEDFWLLVETLKRKFHNFDQISVHNILGMNLQKSVLQFEIQCCQF